MRIIIYSVFLIGLFITVTCGPTFSKIYFQYQIPFSNNYYKFIPEEKLSKGSQKSSKNKKEQNKGEKTEKKPGGFIEVQEERFLQWDSPIEAVQSENYNAVLLGMEGKWKKATQIWEKLKKKYPDDLAVLNHLGIADSLQGYHDQALKYFAKCISLKRHDIYIFHYRATINLSEKYRPIIKN
jgi:tetratricopeptide (TPR) repeat protein